MHAAVRRTTGASAVEGPSVRPRGRRIRRWAGPGGRRRDADTDTARRVMPRRTLAEIITTALRDKPADTPICLVHENMTNVQATKAGTRITLGVPAHIFTPNDALWFTGELGRPADRKPKYVG